MKKEQQNLELAILYENYSIYKRKTISKNLTLLFILTPFTFHCFRLATPNFKKFCTEHRTEIEPKFLSINCSTSRSIILKSLQKNKQSPLLPITTQSSCTISNFLCLQTTMCGMRKGCDLKKKFTQARN